MFFLDITKAFDRVWHNGLLFKLRQFGVEGSFHFWCESYLSNRKQRVVINGCEAQLVDINAGVPQGSIVGPLFFLVVINDIILELETNTYLFSDDTFMLDIFSDPVESAARINRDLMRIYARGVLWNV